MIALVTGAEAAWIGDVLIELVPLLANSITSLVRLSDTQQTQGINLLLEQELELQRGQFCKQILYNNQPINDIQLSEVMNETIIQIDRCCQSVWYYFPSGIVTFFTWALTGQAIRHEFVIIDTTNHICSLELVKDKNDQQKEIYKLVFNIYGLETQEQRKIKRNQILSNRSFNRVLSSIKFNHQLYLSQINQFQNLLLICWEKMYEKETSLSVCYKAFQKMSKQNARSIYYFSLEQPNYQVVLQSIVGIFTDKPFFMKRIDMDFFEEIIWAVNQFKNEEIRSTIVRLINILQSIREGRDISQTIIN